MSSDFEDLLRRLPELERRVRNMVRYGAVEEVDPAKGVFRFKDDGGKPEHSLETDWIPWAEQGGQTKTWTPLKKGQRMVIFSPSGNIADAIGFPAQFSNANGAPSDKGDENVEVIGNTRITRTADQVTIESPKIVLKGEVHLGDDGGQLLHRKGDVDSDGDVAVGSATKVYAV
ncbi:MAG: hypothetical protein ABL893_10830 [Hyphomicrobium sp.]